VIGVWRWISAGRAVDKFVGSGVDASVCLVAVEREAAMAMDWAASDLHELTLTKIL
jgi:hypothetical protein